MSIDKTVFARLWEFPHPDTGKPLQFLALLGYEEQKENPHVVRLMTLNQGGTHACGELRYDTIKKAHFAFYEWLTDEEATELFDCLIRSADRVTKKEQG